MIRVAIAGVGNCASALVQGVEYYRSNPHASTGLMRPEIGHLYPSDLDFVAAFDVDSEKIGRELGEAIYLGQNNTRSVFDTPVPIETGVTVSKAPVFDGLGSTLMHERISHDDSWEELPVPELASDVIEELRRSRAEVLVSYMPVGSTIATEFYAYCALQAGCAFLNAVPTPIACNPEWVEKFAQAGLPLAGDDIKSQLGATILHQQIAALFEQRGISITDTFQLNFGGNMDFYNMLQQDRLTDKRRSKTGAVNDVLSRPLAPCHIHIGPSDYVEWLGDRKWAYIRLEGKGFAGTPVELEMKLEVWDSPNSAGIVIDVVRLLAVARAKGQAGLIGGLEPYFKSPGRGM